LLKVGQLKLDQIQGLEVHLRCSS